MNRTCDRCGPAVRAAYHVSRGGQLYLCGHCANQLRPALSAQGWAIRSVAHDPLGIFGTIMLGIAGSFAGGFLRNLFEHHSLSIHSIHLVGLIGSIIGTLVLLLVLRLTGLERGHRH